MMGFYEALLEPEFVDGVEESATVEFPDQQAAGWDRSLAEITESTTSGAHSPVAWGVEARSRHLSRIAH